MRYNRLIFLSYLIVGIGLFSCSSSNQEDKKLSSIPVHAAQVQIQDVPLYLYSLGTLKPAVAVEIRPQVTGMLQAIHFTEGQFVKKGALLFTIDSQPYIIKLHESEAELAQNVSLRDGARKKLERYASLAKKELIALQEWDEMQLQLARQEAKIRSDEAKVAAARLELQRCEINAPISGKIGKLNVHPGNLISPSLPTALVGMANVEMLTVEFTLTEREYQQLGLTNFESNHPLEAYSLCNPQHISKGALTFIDNGFDPKTGLLLMHGKILNDSHTFLPGQHLQIRIPTEIIKNAMAIPQKAVKINQMGPYVFVIKEDKSVEMRPVKLGVEVNSDLVIVTEGLSSKELVVTEGHLRLSPGLNVEICEK